MKFTTAIVALASASGALAQQNCPAAGSTGPKGQYSCNPAHQYPAGQTCQLVDGCYYLSPGNGGASSVSSAASPTGSCPAAGSTDSQGRYSCNPAHQYPAGQTCQLVGGCYFLSPGNSASSASPTATPSACPAPGSTDSRGRYSCNPAHQYPAGQTCQAVDGCYYLSKGNGATATAPVSTPTTGPVAGAGSLQAAGGLAMAIFGMFLF